DVDAKVSVYLDTKVPRRGQLSQGQRQLTAMARALLRRSSIVVMDEAISSVDFATEFADSLLRYASWRSFRLSPTHSLVGHRLKTIINYDRLIVLDHGRVVEFDTPYSEGGGCRVSRVGFLGSWRLLHGQKKTRRQAW
ncbi:P-loop containing nucleoside triphosphate hydrolase protein, partial [Mycena haematopus]